MTKFDQESPLNHTEIQGKRTKILLNIEHGKRHNPLILVPKKDRKM